MRDINKITIAHDQGLRWRVVRLLHGDFRQEHLIKLFLWLRSRSYGRMAVAEIGHFVAHPHERTFGPVTKDLQDYFSFLRFRIPNLNKHVDFSKMPSGFRHALRGNLGRIPSDVVRKDTGLKHKDASLVLESALSKFSNDNEGYAYLEKDLLDNEIAIISSCIRYIISEPAFNSGSLHNDFIHALTKNKLLHPNERKAAAIFKPFVTLFAVYSMHQTVIALENGGYATLSGAVWDGLIQVEAASKVPHERIMDLQMARPLFVTDLKAQDWCDPDLSQERIAWVCPIDLTPEPKLIPIAP